MAEYTEPNDGYTGAFNAPRGVAVEPDGDLVVADTGNRRVVTAHGALPGTRRIWLPLVFRSCEHLHCPNCGPRSSPTLDNMAGCQVDEARHWRQYQATIAAEVQRMSALTENLRLLAHLETPGVPMIRELVNLTGVVEEATFSFSLPVYGAAEPGLG